MTRTQSILGERRKNNARNEIVFVLDVSLWFNKTDTLDVA